MTAHQSVILICVVACIVLIIVARVVTHILAAYGLYECSVASSVALILAAVVLCAAGGIFLDDLRARGANVRSDTLSQAMEVYDRP